MIKIVLSGCNGKMGGVISSYVATRNDCAIVAGIDKNTAMRFDYPVFASPADFTGEADVLIDFSHPSVFDPLLDMVLEKKIPSVICTTGLSAEQKERIHGAAESIPMFYSANMSLGINLMIGLVKKAAQVLGQDFDIEIVEKHHNQKIDAPSGTAIMLADAIAEGGDYQYIYDRHSVRKKREKSEIGIHSIRGGTIVGEHDVIFAGPDEVLTISHSAASKNVFGVGAVNAAVFLAGKQPGLYDMSALI